LHNQVHVEEFLRADYCNRATKWQPNYITGRMEPYYSRGERVCRYFWSWLVVLICVLVAIVLATCIVIFRVEFLRILWGIDSLLLHRFARIIVSCAAAGLNIFQCIAMSLIHSFASAAMTNREHHRTEADYMSALGLKVFIFETFNIYLPMAYIAWGKGTYYSSFWRDRSYIHAKEGESVGWHTANMVHGIQPLDFCDPSGCLVDLCMTTAIYVCCTQFAALFGEFAVPRAMSCYNQIMTGTSRVEKKKKNGAANMKEEKDVEKRRVMKQWERDYFLIDRDLFWDYVNSVHAFGYTVLFVSTFPIAPLFSLIAHLARARMAAKRMLVDMRRPRPVRTTGVGIWISAIHSIAIVALFTNAFAIALNTNFCDKLVWREDYMKNYGNFTKTEYHEAHEFHERSFQYFRLSRYAITDFAPKAKPIYLPISYDKGEAQRIAFWNIYNNSNNAICFYIGYKLDPFVNNGDHLFHEDIYAPEYIERQNCFRNASRCPKGGGPMDIPEKQPYRYIRKEVDWHVLQMKFKFAVFFVVAVHLMSTMMSFLIRLAKDETVEGIMREAYEEQEMIYRNEINLMRNENFARHRSGASSLADLPASVANLPNSSAILNPTRAAGPHVLSKADLESRRV